MPRWGPGAGGQQETGGEQTLGDGSRNPEHAGGVDNQYCGMAAAAAVCGHSWNLEPPGTGLGKEAGDPAGGPRELPGVRGYGGAQWQRSGDGDQRAPAVTRREGLGRSLPARGRRPPRRVPATAAAIAFGGTDGSRVKRKERRIVGYLGPEAVGGSAGWSSNPHALRALPSLTTHHARPGVGLLATTLNG